MAAKNNLLFLTLTIITLSACEQKKQESLTPETHFTQAQSKVITTSLANKFKYALNDLSTAHAQLENTIDQLLESPTDMHLSAAQLALQNSLATSRKLTLLNVLSRTAPNLFEDTHYILGRLTQFPILPGFIDSYGPYLFSGLVNDISLPITTETLEKQHGVTDSGEVILGYYAIEYVLYGDKNTRAAKDFAPSDSLTIEQRELGLQTIDEIPNNRRRQLLKGQLDLAFADIERLKLLWSEGQRPLNSWKKLPPETAYTLISQTIDHAMTRLLIEIVELNHAPQSPYEALVSPAVYGLNHSRKVEWIEDGLNSITPAWEFYPEKTREHIQKKTLALLEILAQLKLEDNKENWEATYASTKALADAVRE